MSPMKEIAVVEIIHAAKGKTKELREALQDIVPLCRKEEGCLQYELFEPLAGSGQFLVLMRWADPKDLARHEGSETIRQFVQKYDKILYGEVVQTEWKPIS
jgi:quinol monooxygenase YgiN